MPTCPLCLDPRVACFAEVHARRYFECECCRLVFLAPEQRLGPDAERERYETHENDSADPRYRAFLNQLALPLLDRLPPGARGLDFGSGPGPTLSGMLEEQGCPTAIYDPFFAPDAGALDQTYDFVTCTETAEHFYSPAVEFETLDRLVRPGGWLGILTTWRDESHAFTVWNYVRDRTHVCFYHVQTMHWIAAHFGWSLHVPQKNVALFQQRV